MYYFVILLLDFFANLPPTLIFTKLIGELNNVEGREKYYQVSKAASTIMEIFILDLKNFSFGIGLCN